MPNISRFNGITIYMYFDDHNPEHFHAKYGEYLGYFDFDGNMIEGDIPDAKIKLICAWAILRKKELKENWKKINNGEKPEKISPLK